MKSADRRSPSSASGNVIGCDRLSHAHCLKTVVREGGREMPTRWSVKLSPSDEVSEALPSEPS